ncbi:hypothetical protein IAT38_004324 [Cryptococcus sp. DSM 104549]
MNSAHYQSQAGGYDGRDRREEYPQQHPSPLPVPSYQPPPPLSPTNSSPFAFAPPPLSAAPVSGSSSRPPLLAHHSEPPPITQQQQYPVYASMKPQPSHHHSYSYASSAPMSYRSHSGESERHSPTQPSLNRVPSINLGAQPNGGSVVPSQSSPVAGSFQYRQSAGAAYPAPGSGAQPTDIPVGRPPLYPQSGYYATAYSQPTSADMPRSLSYPSSYTQSGYPTYLPGMSVGAALQQSNMLNHPSLVRHNTLGGGIGADARGGITSLGAYGYQNRTPLADRPFKCDECVQSFNRNHDLKRHKRIHLSVKPFGCDKCGKTFSRKDALRRHWLVKGCRGEDGATAPILPLYPMSANANQPPALSPSSPPVVSPTSASSNGESGGPTPSFSHPAAPPPLSTLPTRPLSDVSQSQVIVTPSEVAGQQLARTSISDPVPGLEDPIVLDTTAGSVESGSGQGSAGSMGGDPQAGGYFQGVVAAKHNSEVQGHTSPYSRFPQSPPHGVHGHHPYRRPTLITSSPGLPAQARSGQPSPTAYTPTQFAPSSMGSDGKPVFAMPFTPVVPYGVQRPEAVLAANLDGTKMEKVASQDAIPETWQRWHRPSFPFPAPVNYQFAPSSPIDINAAAATTQSYSQ